jgi:SAM-dependent methyltransferase
MESMVQLYDTIGTHYAKYRRPDPRIAAAITAAIGDAQRIVNIGAGAGSYEPKDREIVAVEPSETMIRQRSLGAAPVVCGSAMGLPFRAGEFDAGLAILTVHHWPDQRAGLLEMARVARRCVVLTWEPSASPSWLTRDYFPEIVAYDRTVFPPVSSFYGALLGRVSVGPVLIPHDCTDGFLEAYWRRPEAYFDPGVRLAISSFARLGDAQPGLTALRRDLDDGTWTRRNGDLMNKAELDLGYRLVVGERD